MKKLMQKGILGILLVLAIFMCIPIEARADDGIVVEKDGDFLYRVEGESDNPEVTIYSYVGSDTDVTVPSEIKGKPVTTLHGTFSGKKTVKKVTVPEGVRLIEYNAFFGCTALTTVVLPSSLEEMTEYTFYECTNLKTVSLDTANSKLTKIGQYSFAYCEKLTGFDIPSSLKELEEGVFFRCSSLKKIIIPDTVEKIDRSAFYECTNVIEIKIPGTVKEASDIALVGCEKVITAELPISMVTLANLQRSDDLETLVIVDDGSTELPDKDALNEKKKLKKVVFPDSLTSIPRAFCRSVSALEEVKLPANLKIISNASFSECTNLKTIDLPDTVTEIGAFAFADCTSLKDFTIPDGIKSIGEEAFYNSGITSLVVPESVETIDKLAFSHMANLTNATFPAGCGITFSDCKNLKTAKITGNPTVIDNYMFYECSQLTDFEIPGSVKKIGYAAFYNTALKEAVIPASVTEIDDWAFADCTSLKDFTIPDGIKSIGEAAFYNSGITSLVVPESVETIDKLAFSHMANLVSATIPAGYGITFNGYTSLKTAKITGNPTAIDDSMFRKCSSLVSIELPDTVTEIGKYAFADCTSLKDFTIPDGIKSIGEAAFYNSGITSLVVPESVETIDKLAFSHMANLVSATIPAGYGITFNGCTSLKTAKITGNLTAIDDWMFNNCGQLSDFDIPDSVTRIGYSAFSGTALKEAVIPAGVTEIDDWAFGECQNLEKAMLPDGLKSIGEAAFYECPELTDSNIPDSVTTLGGYAFSCCPKLKDMTIPDTIDNFGECVFEDTPGVTIDTSRKYFIPTVDGIKDLSYTGSEITQPDMEITVNGMTLKEDSDYEVSYSSNTEIGTATMDINFKGQYVGHLTRTFNVVQIEMSDENITVTGIHNTRYTGKKIVMSKLAVQAGGRTLIPGTDYTVSYKNNLNPGTAEITIAGKGNYTGTVVKTFNILILKGSTYTVGTMKYKVTNAATNGKGTVAIMGTVKAKTDSTFTLLSVPGAVKIGGITYNVTMVNVGAFSGYTYLKKVVIGNGVKAIGSNAFYGCKSITSIIIGRGVTAIGGKTFYGCSKLASISVLSSSIKLIGKETFTRIAAKPVVAVPKAKLAKYKQLMKNAGMTTKAVYRVR